MSDELIEAAARAVVKRNWPSFTEADVDEMWEGHADDMRAAYAVFAPALLEKGVRWGQEAAAKEIQSDWPHDKRVLVPMIRARDAAAIARSEP